MSRNKNGVANDTHSLDDFLQQDAAHPLIQENTSKSTPKKGKHEIRTVAVPRPLEEVAAENAAQGIATPITDAVLMPIERIVPTKDQPRSKMDQERLDDMVADIRKRAKKKKGIGGTGILQALLGRWEPGAIQEDGSIRPGAKVRITAGETRYWAGTHVGLKFLPVIIVDQDEESAYEDALMENLQRQALSEEDEGHALLYLKNARKLSVRELAIEVFGDVKKHGYIQNRLDALKLDDDVKPLVGKSPLTMTHAKRIQTVKDPDVRKRLIQLALDGYTTDQVNEAINLHKGKAGHVPADPRLAAFRPLASGPFAQTTPSPTPQSPKPTPAAAAPAPNREEPAVYGTNTQDTIIMPRFDVAAEMDAMVRRVGDIKLAMDGARPGKDAMKLYRRRHSKLMDAIEALGASFRVRGSG